MTNWSTADIPDQSGRTVVVTGANTGLGFETARVLASKGADVVLACRNGEKADAAVQQITAGGVSGSVDKEILDLADLDSVAAFADRFRADHDRLDLLINNAGLMAPPLGRTKQGFEMQFGVNHLGHFALTGRLLPLLQQTAGARVATMSSVAQNFGWLNFGDLNWESRSYQRWPAYGQSKLANIVFTRELHRRLEASGSQVRSTAAHPGFSATELGRTTGLFNVVTPLVGMNAKDGAKPMLRAATDPDAPGGSYWGPLFEVRGPVARARVNGRAKKRDAAARLWEESEKLTGVSFELAKAE